MKMAREDALRLVQEKLDISRHDKPLEDHHVVVMTESIIEKETYFVIFYNTETYMKTGDPLDGLVGNAPYIVDKATGGLFLTGTADPIEHYMSEYEAGRIDKEE